MKGRATRDPSKVTLPITPMLDMTFQLLFFFVANFNPADLEGQMDLALPSNERQAAAPAMIDPPRDQEVEELPADLTVKVRTQRGAGARGTISAISVLTPEGAEKAVDGVEGLKKYLKDRCDDLPTKAVIRVRGDGRLHLRGLLEVMDACRDAGFGNIGLIPPER